MIVSAPSKPKRFLPTYRIAKKDSKASESTRRCRMCRCCSWLKFGLPRDCSTRRSIHCRCSRLVICTNSTPVWPQYVCSNCAMMSPSAAGDAIGTDPALNIIPKCSSPKPALSSVKTSGNGRVVPSGSSCAAKCPNSR